MNDNRVQARLRFTLRTLMLTVLAVAMLAATAVTRRESQVMWQFSEADGGDAMYGTSYGWPVPYLRVPVGQYAHVPSDWFVPGLIANATIVLLVLAVLYFASRFVHQRRHNRSPASA